MLHLLEFVLIYIQSGLSIYMNFLYSTNLISDIFQFRMIMVHKTLRLINIGMRLIKHSE